MTVNTIHTGRELKPETIARRALKRTDTHPTTPPQGSVLWERLLLLAYAYGTNTGISAVAAGGHGHSETDLRYTARRYFTIDGARAVAIQLANATFAARHSEIWGQSTTTVASDSTHFRAYDQNLFTEWHSRYGGRGVLIYWPSRRNRWSSTPSS